MTDATPRHNRLVPSVDEMRVKASDMDAYAAVGLVVKTCMRVCLAALRRVSW